MDSVDPMLRRTDLLWLLALPFFQIIGTIRHEGSHALAALVEGVKVTEFAFLPSFHPQNGFLWGFVSFQDNTTWFTLAAPYLVDLVTYVVFFAICLTVRSAPHWVWVMLFVIGLVSPLVDSLYNYLGGFFRPQNDVAVLYSVLPHWLVHSYFLTTMVAYCLGLWVVNRYARMVQTTGGRS